MNPENEKQETNQEILPPIEESPSLDTLSEEIISPKEETMETELQIEETANIEAPTKEYASANEEVKEEHLEVDSELSSAGIIERLTAIEETLKQGNQLFENKLLYDVTKEEMVAKLHKELQTYKDDLHKKIVKPIIMDMIVFADSMRALISRYEEEPEFEMTQEKYKKLRNEFLKIGEHIDDLIYNYGVEPFTSEAGSDFDSKIQQSKKISPVESDEDNKKVIASLYSGYCWDDQLLRKEYVHIGLKEGRNN